MRKQVKFREASISFTDRGKGRVVVLLHGFLGSSEIWTAVAEDLARVYRVVSIDLPGHGNSDCLGYAHSMELMAKAVKAVLNGLRLKRYVLIGHSMGGYVALAFAEMFPDNMRGLGLLHCTAYPDTSEKKRERERAMRLILKNKKVYTDEAVEQLFAKKNRKYLKKEIAMARRIARNTSPRGIVAALIGMRDRPGRDIVLGLVDYPVFMVIGGKDEVVSSAQLAEQAELLKHPYVLFLEHDAHMGFFESPLSFRSGIRKFLRRCCSSRVAAGRG